MEEGFSVGGPKDGSRVRHELHVRPLAGPAIFRTSQLSLKSDRDRITFHYFTCALIIIVIIIVAVAALGSDTDCSTNNETPRISEIYRLGTGVTRHWVFLHFIKINFYFYGRMVSDKSMYVLYLLHGAHYFNPLKRNGYMCTRRFTVSKILRSTHTMHVCVW